ncbi:MAG: NUDIX domain-containing protein [Chloroflexota bacterium]|nr:NUDIX domain-containing protein [Chloroflexota bacterium]
MSQPLSDRRPNHFCPPPRHTVVPRTLCFILHGDEVLLIERSLNRHLFPGKINGLGGHVERHENVETAARREILEESGLLVSDLWLAGVVHVDGSTGQTEVDNAGHFPGVMLFVFTAQSESKQVLPTEEGELFWSPLSSVDGLDWVDGDPRLLQRALAARSRGETFFGTIGSG